MGVVIAQVADTGTRAVTPAQKKVALRSAASLTVIAITVIFIVGAVALVILNRHKRRVLGDKTLRKRRKAKRGPDAWVESGKRIDPSAIGSPDDTVDIDPEELGPGDVGRPERPRGGGPKRPFTPYDPHGEGPNQ
jgi:hypothetical protein